MGESQQVKNKTTTQAVMILATTALDATWRTLVPGILGTVLGIIADHAWHTTPFIMIAGLVIGIGISILLIRQQFKALQR